MMIIAGTARGANSSCNSPIVIISILKISRPLTYHLPYYCHADSDVTPSTLIQKVFYRRLAQG